MKKKNQGEYLVCTLIILVSTTVFMGTLLNFDNQSTVDEATGFMGILFLVAAPGFGAAAYMLNKYVG